MPDRFWKLPPKIKIYEALGAVADERVKITGNMTADVQSSSGNKTYQVIYDPQTNTISSNDNGSYWQGYLGYPVIAYLFVIGKIGLNQEIAKWLEGIRWKDLNVKFKNDYERTMRHIRDNLHDKGISLDELEYEIETISMKIKELNLKRPDKLSKPPEGY